MQNLRNALLLHRHTVEHIRRLHRAAAVRDHDKLRFLTEAAQIACKALDISVVQRRVNFIKHTEGRRAHLENCKVQRDGNKRFFAAVGQADFVTPR